MTKLALVILDGWGIGDGSKSDAIANAKTPFMDSLYKKYPHSRLLTFGEHVGLPEGQMGNSEVGHLNIGAGRVVFQDLVRINNTIKDGSFFSNPVLIKAFEYAKESGKAVHLMGLVSNGGVHSTTSHLNALCEMTKSYQLEKVFIHAFMDGRDTNPTTGLKHLKQLSENIKDTPAKVASIVGRYFAMDRDRRWERIEIAYNLLVKGIGEESQDMFKSVQESYDKGITDEFIKPIAMVDDDGEPIATIVEGDVVICFNFRTDRCRQITEALTQHDFSEFGMKKLNLYYLTMTNYDESFKNVFVIFDKDNLSMTLGEVIRKAGKKQLRIAETEKYPHVTFFFSGGREVAFEGESRLLIPSPKVATYDLQPEMSALEVTEAVVKEIRKEQIDFICLNFANPDMVGHTGVYRAIVKAVETIDSCLEKVVEAGLEKDYSFIIVADHGNADYAVNTDGSPNTAHSMNPVPCILIDKKYKTIDDGKLADLAPTILKIMGLDIPKEMDGRILVH